MRLKDNQMRNLKTISAIAALMVIAPAIAHDSSSSCGVLKGLNDHERSVIVTADSHNLNIEGYSPRNNEDLIIAECKLHPRFTIDQAVRALKHTKKDALPDIRMCGA
jgi:hypothetical protein